MRAGLGPLLLGNQVLNLLQRLLAFPCDAFASPGEQGIDLCGVGPLGKTLAELSEFVPKFKFRVGLARQGLEAAPLCLFGPMVGAEFDFRLPLGRKTLGTLLRGWVAQRFRRRDLGDRLGQLVFGGQCDGPRKGFLHHLVGLLPQRGVGAFQRPSPLQGAS